nr:cyclic nucleotide-gated ion channel 1-like isoform X3 [Quercus suber]POE80364.1 cyclic nucleotide-gated ion channel 1 [Quercus suber]
MNLTVGLWRPAVATEDFNSQGNQDIEKQVPKDDGVDLRKKGTTRKTILQNLNPEGKYLQMWNMMFVVSCTIAVSVDPLFFYLPVIKEDNKCLALDDKLKITVICLRSVTDMIYVLNIILQFLCPVKLARTMIIKDAWPIAKRYLLSYFLMDILAILPIPQVLGAFWYLFSIEREMACWHIACTKHIGCNPGSFKCQHSLRNHTFLNDYCPVEPPNTTLFDFGIFLDALQSGTVASKDFPRKFAYRFWWGLRNLSSVGQNLQTSTYIWETLFAVLISICGLLLFLYFIGNLQTYMQLATQRSEDIIQSVKFKERDVDLWIHRNELPLDIKKEIMSDITQILEQKKDVDVEKPLPHLHWELRKKIKDHLCKPLLRKVPLLEKNEQLSQLICDHLKPVYYNEQNYIVREGEPLDAMLFITQGIVWNFITTSDGEGIVTSKAQCIEKELPISTETAKTHTKVEGFALMANDLRTLVSKWKNKEVSSIQAAWRRHHLEKKNEKSNQLVLGNKNCLSSSFSCFKNTCSFSFFKNTSKSSSA